jgi:hypothetical protein
LHQVLVKAGHTYGNKQTTQEGFGKVELTAQEIVKEKYLGIAAVFNGIGGFKNIHVQALANKIYRQEYRQHQEKGLQTIGYNNGF